MPDSTELEDYAALLKSPGWLRLMQFARTQWGPDGGGYARQIKQAISTALEKSQNVGEAVARVDAQSDAINQLISYPKTRVQQLEQLDAKHLAAQRGDPSRRGSL